MQTVGQKIDINSIKSLKLRRKLIPMTSVKIVAIAMLTLLSNTYSSSNLESNCKLYVPNVFSPNNDGVNDKFLPEPGPECILDDYLLKVFNRRGALVFESNALQDGWNGKYRGETAERGVYLYQIQYRMEGSSEENFEIIHGDIALIR